MTETASSRYPYNNFGLKYASPDASDTLHATLVTKIFNDLIGTGVISAFETAQELTCPAFSNKLPVPTEYNLLNAHQELVAR